MWKFVSEEKEKGDRNSSCSILHGKQFDGGGGNGVGSGVVRDNGDRDNGEYSNYTFNDHFGCIAPVLLPRAAVLEYMLARVTQHEDIFQHILFNTTFVSVVYDDEEKEFVVTTRDERCGTRSSNDGGVLQKHTFDKCIYRMDHHFETMKKIIEAYPHTLFIFHHMQY